MLASLPLFTDTLVTRLQGGTASLLEQEGQ